MTQYYHTEGFVLKQIPVGERDLLLSIFTRDFGRVSGRIKSARSIESKMRFHASKLAWVEVTLIKTRNDTWKIVGLNSKSNLASLKNDNSLFRVINNIISLLSRMVIGEEPQEEIFNDVSCVYDLLVKLAKENDSIVGEDVLLVEIIAVARILNYLGYMEHNDEIDPIFDGQIDNQMILLMTPRKKQVIKTINEAFNASGL